MTRRGRTRPLLARRLLCAALAGAVVGCGNGARHSQIPNETEVPPAAVADLDPAGTAIAGPASRELLPVPVPDVAALSPEAQEQIADGRRAMDAALADRALPAADLAAASGDMAKLYHAYELYQAAEPAYLNAAALAPDDMAWPYLLAHLYRALNRPQESVRYFEAVLARSPDDLPTGVWLATVLLDGGETERAAPHVARVAKLVPGTATALALEGRLAAARGDHEGAVALYLRALELAPGANDLHYPLGLSYRALGDMANAERYMRQRGRVQPPLHDPLLAEIASLATGSAVEVKRGLAAIQAGRLDVAEAHLRKAVALNPANVTAITNLAVVLVRTERVDEAIETLQAAAEVAPGDVLVAFNLGTVLARVGRDQEAVAAYEQALAVDPNFTAAHFNLANALLRLGRRDEAAQHYGRVVALDPGNRAARGQFVQVVGGLERWLEARTALEEAHAAQPDDAAITVDLIRVLSAAPDDAVRDGARALALAQTLVQASPSTESSRALAMALAENARFEEAARLLGPAIEALRQAGQSGTAAELTAERSTYLAGRPLRIR